MTQKKPQKSNTVPTDTNATDTDDDIDPTEDYNNVYTKLTSIADANHSDATGRFPTASRRGNKYVLELSALRATPV